MKKSTCVVSVKGGVGKTFVSLNIARRLAGYAPTALVDADIDNSNFATFAGAEGVRVEVDERKKYVPYDWDGVKVVSMSLLVGKDRPISMTADRYAQMLDDAIHNTEWNPDFLVVDMPAGAGDVFRAAVEILADTLVGNIIVMQPAMVDSARRVLEMHAYLGVPVLGIIENMAYFRCPKCKEKHYPFGKSVGAKLAEEFKVPFLGEIPIIPDMPARLGTEKIILEGDVAAPFDNAVKAFLEAEPIGKSLLTKVREAVTGALVSEIQKLVAAIIISVNEDFPLGELARAKGFGEGRTFLLTITSDGGEPITRIPLRVKGDRLVVVKNPRSLDFEIAASVRTLARMVMGRMKRGDKYVPFDPLDAWLMGDLKVYGRGHSAWAVKAFREIFGDNNLMEKVREKYGRLLERWL